MKAPTTPPAPFITSPGVDLAEGELNVDLNEQRGGVEERVIPFMAGLFREALRSEDGSGGESAELSSLSVQRLAGSIVGRIYGQAYVEKRGDTVVFLRARLINDRGEVVMTGMATSHVPR
ncbi:MAG: hypothetical protein ACETWG_04590 [Candidatus Neomarinimicrobiota bacterium]